MTEVDYYKLERAVQDRFSDATRAIGVPVPLLRVPPRDRSDIAWFVAGVAILLVAGTVTTLGVGDLSSGIALAPLWMLGALALGYGASLYCVLRGLAIRHRAAGRPYVAGLYLFPIGIVDARGEPLKVVRLPDIKAIQAVGDRTLRLEHANGSSIVFPADAADVGRAQAALDEARTVYEHAVATQNRRELALLDPLVDSGFASPFSPKLPIPRQVTVWERFALPIALAAGASLAAGIWTVRNQISESLLYERAKQADTAEAYQAYLARGGPRVDVARVLLPRAELRVAERAGTVEAIEAYMNAHPASGIAAEVTTSVRRSLDAEFGAAKAAGTVQALRTFLARRKAYEYVHRPVDEAISALYAKALAAYSAAAHPEHPETLAFVERLLAHARAHGPDVVLRFVRRIPKSVSSADSAVRRSSYFMGKASVPSQYFDDATSERREAELMPRLIARLQEPFPSDVLSFKAAPAVPSDVEEVPAAEVPTLFIQSEPHMSGGYMSRKPRGVFVGIGMKFKMTFAIPGDAEPLAFEASTWRTPNPQILKAEGSKIGDVYEVMAADSYARFSKRFFAQFFAKDPES